MYQKHKIFVLPSLTEGLPNTLCEAMLCGCIPIVSNVGVMPDLVNGFGYVLKTKNVQTLTHIISQAELKSMNLSDIRHQVIIKYPLGKRLSNFNDLINLE